MKVLLFSDLHLETPFAWARPDVARKRRRALRDTLATIVELAIRERVDAVLCGGDLYEHDRCAPDTGEFLREMFGRLVPIRVFLAPGNHDWYGPSSLYQQVPWTPNVHVFTDDRLTPVALGDGVTLWGAAHRAPANTDGFLDRFKVDRDGVHLAVFHGSERSSLMAQGSGKLPHAPFDQAAIERAGLHHVFLGHYHRPLDGDRLTYPGNPEPLAFGEEGNRGVVVATIAGDGRLTRVRHRVSRTQMHDREVDVTGCSSLHEIEERAEAVLAGLVGVARLTLRGELATQIDLRPDDLIQIAGDLDVVVIQVGPLTVAYDYEAIAEEPTVRGQFVRDVLAARDLDDEGRRRVLITGLRAFEGRMDLEVP
jgi:DNA repair exonuclease SbcCD nuclease subunit